MECGKNERELESEAIEQSGRASDIWAFYTCMTMKSSRNADHCRARVSDSNGEKIGVKELRLFTQWVLIHAAGDLASFL
jgi:hypothetical protein